MRANFMSSSYDLFLESRRGMTEEMVTQLAFLEVLGYLAIHYEHRQEALPANIRVEVKKVLFDLDVRLHCEWKEERSVEETPDRGDWKGEHE